MDEKQSSMENERDQFHWIRNVGCSQTVQHMDEGWTELFWTECTLKAFLWFTRNGPVFTKEMHVGPIIELEIFFKSSRSVQRKAIVYIMGGGDFGS